MNYKRLEIYVWWTCNQKCTYCIEFENMEQAWKKKVSKYDILKILLKYRKLGYNHVTFLWWEPFIQPVFHDALILWKKLGYIILVTTNATTLHLESQASKFLPYIDELFLSVEAIGIEDQQKISRTKNYVHWDLVFENISKYWKWKTLKVNIVITQDNLKEIFNIVKFVVEKKIKNISITYPDINYWYYWKEFILKKIAPSYTSCIDKILPVIDYLNKMDVKLKLPDFPFCIFPEDNREAFIKLIDDFDFETRIKISHNNEELDRWDLSDFRKLPRKRRKIKECEKCKYNKTCWGPSYVYKLLYWLDEIKAINN